MKITDAYSAFWFLNDHPKLQYRAATLVGGVLTVDAAKAICTLDKGERFRRVKGSRGDTNGVYVIREMQYRRPALDSNLDVFYAKVDTSRRVNDNRSLNVLTECWLEFGPVKAEVAYGQMFEEYYHDIRLDCGAPTFDEALVKLAQLVKRYYGDYKRNGKQ